MQFATWLFVRASESVRAVLVADVKFVVIVDGPGWNREVQVVLVENDMLEILIALEQRLLHDQFVALGLGAERRSVTNACITVTTTVERRRPDADVATILSSHRS